MPRVRFTRDHVDTPHPMQSVKFKAGGTYAVRQAVAEAVVAQGKGEIVSEAPAARRKRTDADE